MSWFTRMALANRSVVALAVVAIILLSIFAVPRIQQELIPEIEFPVITVFTRLPDASPEEVEQTLTLQLETAIQGTQGLDQLDSYSTEGTSVIIAQFGFGADLDQALVDMEEAVSRAQARLPQGSQPQVQAINVDQFPVMQLAVTTGADGVAELGPQVAGTVVPELESIDGVAAVTLTGLESRELRVALRPQALAEVPQVNPASLFSAIQTANVSVSAGSITQEGLVLPVTVSSEADSLAALRGLPLAQTDVGPVTLGDVAELSVEASAAQTITRTNGQDSIGISIAKTRDGNVVDIAAEVEALLPQLEERLGGDAQIVTVSNQAEFVEQSISSMWEEGIIGAFFAVVVIFLFLRHFRSTIVAGISIPLSVIGALLIIWGGGTSLNILTLGGLTIAIGRVIDDSIVVLENIYRHLQEGENVETAAYEGTKEVAAAITASTLTTVAVFLPLGLVGGISAEFFRPFAFTVTYALVASLFVALIVVPVVATWLLSKRSVGSRDPHKPGGLQRVYLPALNWALKHRAITAFGALAVFVGAVALTPFLSTNLLDQSGENVLTVTQELLVGTGTTETLAAAEAVESELASVEAVETYQMTVGSSDQLFGPGGGFGGSSSQAQFVVVLDKEVELAEAEQEVRETLAALDGVGDISVQPGSGGGDLSQLEVRIFADDPAVLREANAAALAAVSSVQDAGNVSSNLNQTRPQLQVSVRPADAVAAGTDPNQIASTVRLLLGGMIVGQVQLEEGDLPVRLIADIPGVPEPTPELLSQVPLPGAGGQVSLGQVADVGVVDGPVQITHTGGRRTATVTAEAEGQNLGALSTEIETAMAAADLPEGARWELGGASEMLNEVFVSLGIAMLMAVLIVYIIMVGTFRQLLGPLVLLVSIPFAAIGAVPMLLVTRTSLGMPSLIGLLMLIGIVVTNAIVLLDLVTQFREQGMELLEAVREGARRRLRPILMTAVATILALTPMALGLSEGAFVSRPLAVVVIGGLFSSTALTLIIVPVLYTSAERMKQRVFGRSARVEESA